VEGPVIPAVAGIVTYNSLLDLPACLESLRRQTQRPRRVVILDNASTDGTADWVRSQAADVDLLAEPVNIGYGRAHNRILQFCRVGTGEFYLSLNPDVTLAPQYLERVVGALTAYPAQWGTGKILLSGPSSDTPSLYSAGHALLRDGYAFNIRQAMPDAQPAAAVREVFGAPGAAAVLTGELIRALSYSEALFDPDFFLYGEDTDLDWRARLHGFRCLCVEGAIAYHRGSRANADLRMEAVGNRYLSAMKNAFVQDFFSHNLPIMTAHVLVRTLLTPALGIRLARRLLRLAPTMWSRRRPAAVSREAMLAWFRWSAAQPSGAPISVWERWTRR
jgi:GT2 family glycosyltransferase